MSNEAVFEKAKFEVLGNPLENIEKELKELKDYKNRILDALSSNFVNKQSKCLELLSTNSILKVLNENRITFYNSQSLPCEIAEVYLEKENIFIKCKFLNSKKIWKPLKLKYFLNLISSGDFTCFSPRILNEKYLCSIDYKLDKLNIKIASLENEYKELYKQKEKEINKAFYKEINQFKKLDEAETKQVISKNKKGIDKVKEKISVYLNSEEKSNLMTWISDNIYSIRIYAIEGGRAEGRLSYYKDFGNQKLRKANLDKDGKLITSCDSANGYISFKNVISIPENINNIFKKVCQNRNSNVKSLFNKNRLNDFNFALYLLSEYNEYGFKSGIRNLNKEIDKSFILNL